MTHCMIDLETWGTAPGCVVRSIGAVVFDPRTCEMGDAFYANLQEGPQLAAGLVKDTSTVDWWARQSPEAQAVLLEDPQDPAQVLENFWDWYSSAGVIHPWSHGKEFDLPIWGALSAAFGRLVPWKFFNTMDTRTVYTINGFDQRSIPFEGVKHNALDDARHQVRCVAAALARGRQHHFQRGYWHRVNEVREALGTACCPDESTIK